VSDLMKMYQERVKALPVLIAMERGGVTVNYSELVALRDECRAESERHQEACVAIAKGYGYDLTMPRGGRNGSLDTFVFDVLKLPPLYDTKGKTQKPLLDSKVAVPYYLEHLPPESDGYRFIEGLRNKRGKDTAVTYLDGYERYGQPLEGCSGWLLLHPNFNPTGTSLLRRSSSNPNGQNVGKRGQNNLRRCFGPAPGREWWSMDAKNLELRIPAYESGERELIDLFERADDPPYYGSEHLLNFSTVYPDLWEEELRVVGLQKVGSHVKKLYEDTWYQWCKNGDFAMGYGAIDRPDGLGTADRAFHRPGSQARLAARFARKEKLNQQWVSFANLHGYVETIPDRDLGCSRGYPLMVTRTQWSRIRPTEPLNYHVQGTAGWWMLKALNRCHAQLVEWSLERPGHYRLALEVHDELVFDFPRGTGKEPWRTNLPKIKKLKHLMEQGGEDLGVPTPVDVEYHAVSWGEGVRV